MKQIRLWKQYQSGWVRGPHLVPLEPPAYAIVDDCDFPWLSQWQWFVMQDGSSPIGPGRFKYKNPRTILIIEPDDWRIESMHRLVLEACEGPSELNIRHKDGDALNNGRANLQWTAHGRAYTGRKKGW